MTTPGYKNADLPCDERVEDLLSRMTLEEKIAQMQCLWRRRADTLLDAAGRFDQEKARAAFSAAPPPGHIARPSDAGDGLTARQMAEVTNEIQRFFIEASRLGIPVIFHEECLHGLAARESTSFPQPIGLAATFDTNLVERIYSATAAEARARGTHQALTPVLDVAREPRWGRVEETFGEDPWLVSRMGVAAVRGFQGDGTFRDKRRVIATLKHFAAHGQPESGTNCAPVNVSMRVLRETFLSTFRAAVREAGALSVMPSYNEIDGVPSHANRWLLQEVLRGEWGFRGTVVSDYFAITELHDRHDTFGHHVAHDAKDSARLSVLAGVDMELPDPDCYPHLAALVREGTLPESVIDERVRPILRAKFQLRLFEDPYVDPGEAERLVRHASHRDLALEAARRTITLLKNDGGILPLDPNAGRTIAVIGPNADRVLLGGYSGVPLQFETVLSGIKARLPAHASVLYHEGCRITIGGSWTQDEVVAADPAENRRLIREAAALASQADLVILAIGDNEQTSREGWGRSHLGDRATLDRPGQQDELIDAIAAAGKPIVALLFSGRPASISNLSAKASAILELWYLGQECGRAAAEVLFGDVTPGAKLPITIPRSVGHVPAYYNYKPSARRGYLFDSADPLYAFGFGLSYATFAFSNLRLERDQIGPGESARVFVDVTNTGRTRGDEVVQLYIRDDVSSVTRPLLELKGFQRVSLEPGESRTLDFEIKPSDLWFFNADMKRVVEPGTFSIFVGPNSVDLKKATLTVA
jgi:beta-glucosidase